MALVLTRRPSQTAAAATVRDESVALVPLDDPRWMSFVTASEAATPFHHPAWARALSATYGFPAFAVTVLAGAEVVAGVPFLEVRDVRGARRWISLPFTDECRPLATTETAETTLLTALGDGRLGAPPIELRARADAVGWQTRAEAVVHELELVPDAEELKDRFSRSQVVRNIARAEREGVVVRRATNRAELECFYQLHLATRRRQGVPVQPRRFFDRIWENLIEPGIGTILLAYMDGNVVAAALFLSWNGTTVYKFGASDRRAWPKRPNHALFWSAICDSCARGNRRFDFGRTDLGNVGLRAFKAGWASIERPLVYSTLRPGAMNGGESTTRRALAAVIQFSPDWVCRRLGEVLYRYAA